MLKFGILKERIPKSVLSELQSTKNNETGSDSNFFLTQFADSTKNKKNILRKAPTQ